jgi:hypothetical protein
MVLRLGLFSVSTTLRNHSLTHLNHRFKAKDIRFDQSLVQFPSSFKYDSSIIKSLNDRVDNRLTSASVFENLLVSNVETLDQFMIVRKHGLTAIAIDCESNLYANNVFIDDRWDHVILLPEYSRNLNYVEKELDRICTQILTQRQNELLIIF